MPNYIAPGPKQGPQNGLSIERATRCASRFPNWKMGSALQSLLSRPMREDDLFHSVIRCKVLVRDLTSPLVTNEQSF